MGLNTPPDRFGGVRNPLQPGGIYIAKVVREHGNGTVTVYVKTLGSTIGPIKVANYTPSTVPTVGEQVLVSFLDNLLSDMVVIGRISPRVDELSIADNLIVDSSTSDALVRFTQRGTGDVLRVEDSTNVDSTPLIVTADGSVGIGLSSPSKKLHVSGDAQITGNFTVGSSSLFFDVSNDNLGIGTTSPAAKLHVTGSTSGELVRITQTGAGAALLVEDSTNPDSTPFTVDASGKVGIGTTSPAAMFHVTDSGGYGAQIRSTTNLGLLGSNAESDGLRISGGIPDEVTVGGNIYVYGNTHATRAANVTINTNGTEVITVNSSGNVGIGNTSPTAKLDITGSALISGSLNKVTITAPATSATLTIANGKTLTASNTLTLAGTDSTTMTFPSTSQTIAGLAVSSQVFTTAQTFRATSAIRSEAASTQDAIVIAGRAGGTSSYAVTITPATLSSSSTLTLPNTTGTVVTTGDTGTVTNTMLAGSIANTKTTATSSNTASAIVARDASGNFSAGTITATLSGSASTLTTTRTIWGQNFDGSANVSGALSGATTISATTSVTAPNLNIDSTHFLRAVSGQYGSIEVTGNNTAYAGYGINGNAVFMSNGSSFGLYDDTNNQWFMYKDFGGESRFYYGGTERILIKSDGVSIRGDSSGTGVNGTLNAYAYYGNSNVDGTGNASYHPAGIYSTGSNWFYGTTNWGGNTQTAVGHGQPNANNTYYWGLGVFGVNAWSTVGAYQFYNPSDIRYKQNIAPLPLGINFLRLLDPIKFTYLYPQFTEESGNTPVSIDAGTRYRAGLSAQNVKEALNSLGADDYAFWALVDKEDPENGVQILDYTGLVAPIIQAIKELDARVSSLTARIEQLEA